MRRTDFREYLFLAIKFVLVVFQLIHLMTVLIAWRQVINMNNQVRTRTGSLLALINMLNIIVVFIILLILIYLLGSELP